MNDLQIGLLAVGSAVVACVFVYNRYQERKYRRQAEELFTPPEADALLTPEETESVTGRFNAGVPGETPDLLEAAGLMAGADAAQPRADAAFSSPANAEPEAAVDAASLAIEEALPSSVDPEIDYVSWILARAPMRAADVKKRLRQQPMFSKSALWLGLEKSGSAWREVLRSDDDVMFSKLVARLQIVDRIGPIAARDLSSFTRFVQDVAQSEKAICPEVDDTRRLAVRLDQVCADVDVQVGLNILAPAGTNFPAARIQALAHACDMKLSGDGAFHRYSANGQTLFTLGSYDNAPFSAATIHHEATQGVTLLLDVPRVENGVAAFEAMVATARHMAAALDAPLVDDNRRELTEAGVQTILRQLDSLYAAMAEVRIRPGSPSALRLFS